MEKKESSINMKSFMKKPSFKPKKEIANIEDEKLDDDLGMIKLTKDEADRRLAEYVSSMIMNKVKSQKWESRVIGIQWLQEWMEVNKVSPSLIEYAFRSIKGAMKEWKETNTKLTKAAVEFILGVLQSTERLGRRSITTVIPFL